MGPIDVGDSGKGNLSENCADLASGIIKASGEASIDQPKTFKPFVGSYTYPNKQYENFVNNNEGESIEP